MISPSQDDVLTVLRSFLLNVLPGINAYVAVENRVPEPVEPDFALMTPNGFRRLSTNIDTFQDVKYTGAIAPNSVSITGSISAAPLTPGAIPSGILTVTAVGSPIVVGADLSGQGVATGTYITGQLSGTPGGVGTYSVNISQNFLSGSITASWGTMTVSSVAIGNGLIAAGLQVFGVSVAVPTVIRAAAVGGGVGSYVVSPTQTIASRTLSSGYKQMTQKAQVTVQVDFHSQTGNGADMAQTFTTAFRDEYAVIFFSSLNANIAPFYADDPRFAPFQNENQQYEYRWIAEAQIQIDQTVIVPAQFADSLAVILKNVDSTYPP